MLELAVGGMVAVAIAIGRLWEQLREDVAGDLLADTG